MIAVTFRSRLFAIAVTGFLLGHLASAQEPKPLPVYSGQPLPAVQPSSEQRLADIIASNLRQSGTLRHYSVQIYCSGGVAALTGQVTDQSQREEVLRIVQAVPGVDRVVDRLSISAAVRPIQAEFPPVPDTTAPAGPDADIGPTPTDNLPLTPPPAGANNGMMAEPTPIFAAPAPPPFEAVPPRMPPHAWPTYAPYNNYSRVATPLAYPYNAFPFIGPVYPFPKVPLGWRSVKLEWEDGHWWFRKTPTAHDWWRLRYW
jgi:hypothetical protein